MQITKISDAFKRLFKDEQGQSTTEYILILAVVVMIAMKFKNKIGTVVETVTDNVENQIKDNLSDITKKKNSSFILHEF